MPSTDPTPRPFWEDAYARDDGDRDVWPSESRTRRTRARIDRRRASARRRLWRGAADSVLCSPWGLPLKPWIAPKPESLGVGDAQREALVLALCIGDEFPDLGYRLRPRRAEAIGSGEQGHDAGVGDVCQEVGVVMQGHARLELRGGSRHRHVLADGVRLARVEAIVTLRHDLHGSAKDRICGDVLDSPAFEVGCPTVVEGCLVLSAGHHRSCPPWLLRPRPRHAGELASRSGRFTASSCPSSRGHLPSPSHGWQGRCPSGRNRGPLDPEPRRCHLAPVRQRVRATNSGGSKAVTRGGSAS